MASIQISKTDLKNIISQLEKYISLGRKVTAPTDTSQRNRIRMATVLKRKLVLLRGGSGLCYSGWRAAEFAGFPAYSEEGI